ncbi:HAD hydrolase family protein [Paenibacillus humicola]|uniref:HAD hydrolase family protein n=1 Tax=Paenibacillus humicola TaxID=3110540 RepID=UPI003B832F4E
MRAAGRPAVCAARPPMERRRRVKTLYLSDLDGTLLNEEQRIGAETAEILNALIDRGHLFTVATARSFESAFKLLKDIRLQLPIAFFNGVFIFDPAAGRNIRTCFLDSASAQDIIEHYERSGLHPLLYTMDESMEPHIYYKGVFNSGEETYISSRLRGGDRRFRLVDSFDAGLRESVVSVNAIDLPVKLTPSFEAFRHSPRVMAHFGPDIYAPGFHWLEFAERRANKRDAALFLKRCVQAEKLVCFGDNLNDLGMFEAADEKYAVANAHEALIREATATILSNREQGVARFLALLL